MALLGFLASAPPGWAGTPIGYAGDFRAEIERAFFESLGSDSAPEMRVSHEKVRAYREFLDRKQRFVLEHIATYERVERGRSAKRAARRADESDLALAIRVAHERLDQLVVEGDLGRAYDLAADVLTLDYATRSHTEPIGSIKIPGHLKNMVTHWSLPARTRLRAVDREAGNLVDPRDGSFYTRSELAALVRAGSDLSELDPPDATSFWRRKPDISGVDVVASYLGGGDPVHEGLVAEFPPGDGAVVEYDALRLTQSKPKMDVFYTDPECAAQPERKQRRCRQKIKLKFGMEVHADPVANALLATLGYNVDISMTLENVRVYLGGHSRDEIERLWAGYFDRQRMHIYFPMHTLLAPGAAGHGRDERGEYLVFREAVAEVKAPEIARLGFFAFSEGLASTAREARALHVFNAWIANADMKDEENNKLSLRQAPGGEWKLYLVQQDLGHALGYMLPEKPGTFPWDLVDSSPFSRLLGVLRGRIELTYLNLQDAGLERTTTYADAKWMARLIAQLTREQIAVAVGLGRWPAGVEQLYVEKLVNRRNDLVEVFDLESEFALLEVDRGLTTPDGSVVDGELLRSEWPDSGMRYGGHWADLLDPVGLYFLDAGLAALQLGVGAFDQIDPGRITLSSPVVLSPDILIEVDRRVDSNPSPEARRDQYIVRDSVAIGVNVGVGYYGAAEASLLRRWVMAYPAPTRSDGLRGQNRMLSLLLPVDVRRGKLPERYVLLREDGVAGGARISSDDSDELFDVLGGSLSFNRVGGRRSVIDRRGDEALVWVDRPSYWRTRARAFLKAVVLEIPFATADFTHGDLEGRAWRVAPAALEASGPDGVPLIERFIREDDADVLEELPGTSPRRVATAFTASNFDWSLIVVGGRHQRREETILHEPSAGGAPRLELQAERRRATHWQILDNGERQEIQVTAYNSATPGTAFAPEAATLVTRYHVDDLNAHNDEFDGYYDFLAGIGVIDAQVARDFDARDWEISGEPDGRWTHLLTSAEVHYRASALEALLAVDEASFWSLLAEELGTSAGRMVALADHVRRREPRLGLRGAWRTRGRERWAIVRALGVVDELERARGASSERQRLRHLVDAVYRANFRAGHTFDPTVIAALHRAIDLERLADEGAVFVRGEIGRPLEKALNIPEKRTVVGQRGHRGTLRATDYRFFPATGVDLYRMLDWMREEPATR